MSAYSTSPGLLRVFIAKLDIESRDIPHATITLQRTKPVVSKTCGRPSASNFGVGPHQDFCRGSCKRRLFRCQDIPPECLSTGITTTG
jgi:hypothetical protein